MFTRLCSRTTLLRSLWTTVTANQSGLTIHALNDTVFPYIWLRDACQSPISVHPSTSQKLFLTADIPFDIKPAPGGLKVVETGLEINWSDCQKSSYTSSFLERHSSPANLSAFHQDVSQEAWDARDIAHAKSLFVNYDFLQSSSGLLLAIEQLLKYGLIFITGVPSNETADDTCELRILANRFGEIRETFYGQTWDVKNVCDSKNIAYTNLDLGLHMDLLYFQHPPRYQILHCLRNRVTGGTSVFSDALRAAQTMRVTHPEDFATLTESSVAFHYINDGHHLHYEHPTIELGRHPSKLYSGNRPILNINYSPPFQAPFPLSTPASFFPAFARFTSLVQDPRHKFSYTLREGDAVMFDNRRVLHARTAFEDQGCDTIDEGGTNRWLKGCYLEADAVKDRGRALRAKLTEPSL